MLPNETIDGARFVTWTEKFKLTYILTFTALITALLHEAKDNEAVKRALQSYARIDHGGSEIPQMYDQWADDNGIVLWVSASSSDILTFRTELAFVDGAGNDGAR